MVNWKIDNQILEIKVMELYTHQTCAVSLVTISKDVLLADLKAKNMQMVKYGDGKNNDSVLLLFRFEDEI